MAGWFDFKNDGAKRVLQNLKGPIKKILNAGQVYDDMVIKQKIGIGPNEAAMIANGMSGDEDMLYFAQMYDVNSTNSKMIGFYQANYEQQVAFLTNMARQREISKIIETIANEAIVIDEDGFFCRPNTSVLDDLDKDKKDEILKNLNDEFERIYVKVFGFKDSSAAWELYKKFLVQGIVAFELVYNEKGDKIVKAVPIDGSKIVPMDIEESPGKRVRVWKLYPGDTRMERVLPDTHVIYISYVQNMNSSNFSYVQGLIRSYNLFRTLENTAVIWNIMNSSFRMKMIVPVAGSKMEQDKQIGQLLAKFREDIVVDEHSGEVAIDGQPGLNLFRNYAFASKGGVNTTIESMKFEGYDMSNPELMKYWRDKLWEDSCIPYTRLQRDGSAIYKSDSEGLERDEIKFGKMINRDRSTFSEIITKALWTQMCLNYPDFKDDDYFKSKISIKYNSENHFELLRKRDSMGKSIDAIQKFMSLVDAEGKPFFDLELVVEKYGGFDSDFLLKNKEVKKKLANPNADASQPIPGGPMDTSAPAPEVAMPEAPPPTEVTTPPAGESPETGTV